MADETPQAETSTTDAPPDTDVLNDTDREAVEQADRPDAVRGALQSARTAEREARREAQELRDRVAQFEDGQRSEAERLEHRATAAEEQLVAIQQENEQLRLDSLRSRIAAEENLPAHLADRIRGTSEDELRDDARSLATASAPDLPANGWGGGPRGEPVKGDMNNFIRAGARR